MLTDLQNNIAAIMNECTDHLESMINHNTVSISALKKINDFLFMEIKTLKTDVRLVKT